MSIRPAAGATQQSSSASTTATGQDNPDSVDIKDVTDAVLSRTCDDLIEEVVLGLCFEIHRSVKMGTFFLPSSSETNEKEYEIVDEIGLDVFGQVPMKKQLECICPNCQRNLAASRFAPHLEKCMGMGRSSSRIANRRIANTSSCGVLKDNASAAAGSGGGSCSGGGTTSVAGLSALSDQDDENDDDWTYNSDRKGPKKKREKNINHSPRRPKTSKMKNGETVGVGAATCSSEASYPNYESMSIDDRKVLLVQMCGVISEHTRRMCTRSHRCPQHSDDQRKAVRVNLLGPQLGSSLEMNEDVQVETLDDLEGQLLRDSLWESSTSANPSPTDSTSTNNSTASTKKREKRSKNGTNKRNKKTGSQNPKNSGTNIAVGTSGSVPSTSTHLPPPPTQEQCS